MLDSYPTSALGAARVLSWWWGNPSSGIRSGTDAVPMSDAGQGANGFPGIGASQHGTNPGACLDASAHELACAGWGVASSTTSCRPLGEASKSSRRPCMYGSEPKARTDCSTLFASWLLSLRRGSLRLSQKGAVELAVPAWRWVDKITQHPNAGTLARRWLESGMYGEHNPLCRHPICPVRSVRVGCA